MYIVISKPKRMSSKDGLDHFMAVSRVVLTPHRSASDYGRLAERSHYLDRRLLVNVRQMSVDMSDDTTGARVAWKARLTAHVLRAYLLAASTTKPRLCLASSARRDTR
jgi:hypothetical protein